MKVFKINDYEWYWAETVEDAVKLAMADSGLPEDEACDKPYELTDEQMQKLIFVNDDGERWSFAEELAKRIENGEKPGSFACTEY